LSRKCGKLNVSQPYGPPQPVIRIVLTLPYHNEYITHEGDVLIVFMDPVLLEEIMGKELD
jgi:hypothetical protein